MARRPTGSRGVRSLAVLTLAVCLAVTTGGLTWLGYRATREWQRSTLVSVERRGNEVLALLMAALEHDMRGAQSTVLLPINQEVLDFDAPYDSRIGSLARLPASRRLCI